MHRIDGDGAVADQNGPGKTGFNDTNPNATMVTAAILNDMQEEICEVIERAGFTLVKGTRDQLADALDVLYDTPIGQRVVGPGSSTDNHIATFDSTTGKVIQDNTPVAVSDAGAITGVTDITLSGEASYNAGKSRTVLMLGSVLSGAGWVGQPGGSSKCTSNSSEGTAKLPVPQGATLTSLRVSLIPGAARATGADRMQVQVRRVTGVSTAGIPVNTLTGWSDATDTGSALGQFVGDTSVSHVHNASEALMLTVKSGNTSGAANDEVYGIEVVFTEPRAGGVV